MEKKNFFFFFFFMSILLFFSCEISPKIVPSVKQREGKPVFFTMKNGHFNIFSSFDQGAANRKKETKLCVIIFNNHLGKNTKVHVIVKFFVQKLSC